MVFVQKWPFFQLFFRQYRPGNVFHDIQERKNACLGYKNKKLTHGFGPKMTIFPNLFLSNIGQANAYYHILEQKNA